MAAAHASAAEAATAAEAAKQADANAQKYDQQAGTDAVYAGMAANEAESEAAAADREADDAEKDAASARSAAGAAEKDAASARGTATKAEQDATAAESAAKNADGAAKEADQAADRAEQDERKRLEAQRRAAMEAGGTGVPGGSTGPALSADDEAILRAQCGQQCVDDYRAAQAAVSLSVIDWLKASGGEILLEVLGVNNVKANSPLSARRLSGSLAVSPSSSRRPREVGRPSPAEGHNREVPQGPARRVRAGRGGPVQQRGRGAQGQGARRRQGRRRQEAVLRNPPHLADRRGLVHQARCARQLKNGREVGLQTTHVKGGIMGYAIDVTAGAATKDEIRAVVQTLIDDDRLREDLIAKSTEAMRIFNQDAANQKYNENLQPGQKPRALRWGCQTNFAPKLRRLVEALKEISRQKGVG
ncbi:hypothetical protein [Streptomyces sp. NPDC029041]|uniref:hypothetical protein n=1 Tax=Streptomyces sp. NPDC029041 TaxID=3155727 RepID=UPI0033EACE0E